ncbi:MAG TPA: DUF2480 family protein [Cyclobacteriaceae bacterium]
MSQVSEQIVNRVENSSLVTLNLEDYYQKGDRLFFDLKGLLFNGLILKEKDFRGFVKEHDWSQYADKFVSIGCSVEAIIPQWAYMIIANKLQPYAAFISYGDLEQLESELFLNKLRKIDPDFYKDKKVVVKGCSDVSVPTAVYIEVTKILTPVVISIMYGEPCSTVPVYKKPRKK